ncbi:MAG: DUF167 domain-containing protein [Candidatus Woesearchaeota archaeon]
MVTIKENIFSVVAKPNSSKNEILGYDSERKAYKIAVAAPAQDGRANLELVKFLSKELKKKAVIRSGFKGKRKIIELV